MVQKQLQFHRPFRLAKPGPIEQAGAQFNHRGVQAKELVPEPESSPAEIQLPASVQELVKHLLV